MLGMLTCSSVLSTRILGIACRGDDAGVSAACSDGRVASAPTGGRRAEEDWRWRREPRRRTVL
eukprot:1898118-Lingulodinium_polyedra.AAC.1